MPKQPNNRHGAEGPGEARDLRSDEAHPPTATPARPIPAIRADLMKEVLERDNFNAAFRRVKRNRGAPGVDGMTVDDLLPWGREHGEKLLDDLAQGRYRPQPVLRARIPKPGGGERELGIPTVVDRLVQQAVVQVLQRHLDSTFSDHSYGFRPNRSAHQAVAKAQEFISCGYRYVVDVDLEKFFDRVNHDRLMSRLAGWIEDKRLLRLIRRFLEAGVMEDGLVHANDEGTPQGGPLSPLLSNVVLDELDRELERRGHRFVRYADDCNIYAKSKKAAERTMASVARFVARKLKLKVNKAKSAVDRPWRRKFLGFSFTSNFQPKRRVAPQALAKLKAKVRDMTRRRTRKPLKEIIGKLSVYLRGWGGYFGHCQTPSVFAKLDRWIRGRLRAWLWKAWKHGPKRYRALVQGGIDAKLAAWLVWKQWGPTRMAGNNLLAQAVPNHWFANLGLYSLTDALR